MVNEDSLAASSGRMAVRSATKIGVRRTLSAKVRLAVAVTPSGRLALLVHFRGRADDEWIRRTDYGVIASGIIVLLEYMAHGVEAGSLFVIALDDRPGGHAVSVRSNMASLAVV